MYVYRDTGEPDEPEAPVTAAKADEQEAAYWYGTAEPEQPASEQDVRGPFEPLVSSTSPQSSAPEEAEPAEAEAEEEQEDTAGQHERKLEQIKDFYLTAEAIGEENVGKHFDKLLAQQRELIGEYFKQSQVRLASAAEEAEADGSAQAEAAPT